MVWLGRYLGPRTSEIINKLGCTYFGITPQEFAQEIEWEEYAENRCNTIEPVRVDETGRIFVVFSSPDRNGQKYYLDDDEIKKLGNEFRSYSDEKREKLQI